MLGRDEETIIAQCTPQGSGAIALLRLCGNNVREVVNKIAKIPQDRSILTIPSGTVNFGHIIDQNGSNIDQVMFIVMDGPKTFTGQNTIEITCHNNLFLIEKIIIRAIDSGARLAQNGEFTRRAVLNNKIDLIQAEAINDLIHANTELGIKKSLSQLEGSLSHWISSIETKLIKALAWSEASFEFLDEEAEFGSPIKQNLEHLLQEIINIKSTFDLEKQVRQGIRIALIGAVNAGKSSLFNALLNQNRSIVTDIAGTTRDIVESGLYKNGNYWTLVDTAGIRQTDDIIEKEGIRRSLEQANSADIILLIFDSSRKLLNEEYEFYNELLNRYQTKTILIKNKIDLDKNYNYFNENSPISFSNQTKINLDTIEMAIANKINTLFSKIELPFLLNKRQFNNLVALESKLKVILEMLNHNFINYELISLSLREAIEYISELTGKTISEASLDMVFKEFCVGK